MGVSLSFTEMLARCPPCCTTLHDWDDTGKNGTRAHHGLLDLLPGGLPGHPAVKGGLATHRCPTGALRRLVQVSEVRVVDRTVLSCGVSARSLRGRFLGHLVCLGS